MFIPLPVSFAFVIFSSFNSSFPSLPLQEIGKWTVSVYCSFSFSDTPFVSLFCFLSTFVGLLKLRLNLSVCSPIRAFHGPYCYDASTHLSLFSSILPFIKRWGWLFFFLAVLFSQIVFSCHLCSLSLRSLLCSFGFLCQDEKITLVCRFRSESFSSGSLPHAASLTAWVKRTDPPRIANVLRGNPLNYSHCGGEDIHWHQTPQGYAVFSPKASSCLQKMKHRCVIN